MEAEGEEEKIILSKLNIIPETTEINKGVNVEVEVLAKEDIVNVEWIIQYTVDVALKRKIIILQKKKQSVDVYKKEEKYEERFEIEDVDFSFEGVSRKDLFNVGLFSIIARQTISPEKHEDLITINMVTQITKNDEGALMKTIINPLE